MVIRKCCALLLAGSAAVVLFLACLRPHVALAYPPGPDAAVVSAPQAAIDAPYIRIKRVTNTNNADLSWSHVYGTEYYEIYRSTQPYPQPGVAPANRINDFDARAFGDGSIVDYVDDGVDRYSTDGTLATVKVIGDPATNYFWLVQGRSGPDVSGGSNLVGEFDFSLAKGS